MSEYNVRCPSCSVGVDANGANIGGLVSQYVISCETPEGTVGVAKIARCINMGGFRQDGSVRPPCEKIHDEYFKLLPDGARLGLTKNNILNCCRNSRGYLFTLAELRKGDRGLDSPVPPDYNESAERASEVIF